MPCDHPVQSKPNLHHILSQNTDNETVLRLPITRNQSNPSTWQKTTSSHTDYDAD